MSSDEINILRRLFIGMLVGAFLVFGFLLALCIPVLIRHGVDGVDWFNLIYLSLNGGFWGGIVGAISGVIVNRRKSINNKKLKDK